MHISDFSGRPAQPSRLLGQPMAIELGRCDRKISKLGLESG